MDDFHEIIKAIPKINNQVETLSGNPTLVTSDLLADEIKPILNQKYISDIRLYIDQIQDKLIEFEV